MSPLIVFVLGLLALVGGAEALVRGASAIARRAGVSDLVIGLTVVAFGTSSPELVVNVLGARRGDAEIAIGNVVGSNIFNVLCILGISALVYPLTVTANTVRKEIPLSLLAVVVMGVLANDVAVDGGTGDTIQRSDGLVLLAFFSIFLYYLFEAALRSRPKDAAAGGAAERMRAPWAAMLAVAGLVLLFFGGRGVVAGAVWIAQRAGLSESLIALTIVSAGTSLPELATSVVASLRRNADIAVGNIVGSNIFNVFFILGTSATVAPLPVRPGTNVDLVVLAVASAALSLAMFSGGKRLLDRWEGAVLLAGYVGYLAYLMIRR